MCPRFRASDNVNNDTCIDIRAVGRAPSYYPSHARGPAAGFSPRGPHPDAGAAGVLVLVLVKGLQA